MAETKSIENQLVDRLNYVADLIRTARDTSYEVGRLMEIAYCIGRAEALAQELKYEEEEI